jgi:hypothetical protein
MESPMYAFDREYQSLSELGVCAVAFGSEHLRVKHEWGIAGQPEDIETFIRRRANIGPDRKDVAPR